MAAAHPRFFSAGPDTTRAARSPRPIHYPHENPGKKSIPNGTPAGGPPKVSLSPVHNHSECPMHGALFAACVGFTSANPLTR
jgi:hypothetical protein